MKSINYTSQVIRRLYEDASILQRDYNKIAKTCLLTNLRRLVYKACAEVQARKLALRKLAVLHCPDVSLDSIDNRYKEKT